MGWVRTPPERLFLTFVLGIEANSDPNATGRGKLQHLERSKGVNRPVLPLGVLVDQFSELLLTKNISPWQLQHNSARL